MPLHLTESDLRAHLREQIQFLISSAHSYDNGFFSEAKRMAVILRVLLHDTPRSHSLLSQLNKKNIKFYDLAYPLNNRNLLTSTCLLFMRVTQEGTTYEPLLDSLLQQDRQRSKINFREWWNKPVIKDNMKNKFSRKDLITTVTNQDGGAHVDPSLDDQYAALSRFNSIGWELHSSDGRWTSGLNNQPELASIRQITHEVLKTLHDEYPELF
jgi:hypothetical protein